MIRNILYRQIFKQRNSPSTCLYRNGFFKFSSEQSQNDAKQQQQNQSQEQSEQQKQRQQQQEEAKERVAKEAAIRKQMKEEQEINELKSQFESSNTSFSTLSCQLLCKINIKEFMKLIRSRLLLGGAGLFTLFIGYQLYDITETHVDPVDGAKKVLPIKKRYDDQRYLYYQKEQKLANTISGVFQGENKIINSNKKLYNKVKKVQQMFKLYEKMEFPVNGNIYIVDRDSFIFFMLPNGDMFVSRRAAFDLKETELQILMGYELSHIYMRSSTKNIPFSEFGNILLMKLFDFTELFNQFVPLQEIRQYYTLPLSQEQENNNLTMAADILDEIGVELDPESLKYYLKDICSTFAKDPNPYIMDFSKKHPYIF